MIEDREQTIIDACGAGGCSDSERKEREEALRLAAVAGAAAPGRLYVATVDGNDTERAIDLIYARYTPDSPGVARVKTVMGRLENKIVAALREAYVELTSIALDPWEEG